MSSAYYSENTIVLNIFCMALHGTEGLFLKYIFFQGEEFFLVTSDLLDQQNRAWISLLDAEDRQNISRWCSALALTAHTNIPNA